MTLFSTNSLVMNGFFDFSKDGFGFVDSLKVMLLGLIIIFVVTGVFDSLRCRTQQNERKEQAFRRQKERGKE